MSGASLGNSLVSTAKKIAEDVSKKRPSNRKAKISNVDNMDYKVDADIDLPVGNILMSSRAIVTPYAGDGYGFICSPRENQSVIVLPVDNDNNKAVVIGRTYDIDVEKPPVHNLGDVLLRHQLGSQWSFSYSQPITGDLNLDTANQLVLTLVEDDDDNPSDYFQLTFLIKSATTASILPGQIIRTVLEYEAEDSADIYLNVNIEWESLVEYNESNEPFIVISDSNTVVGGPLYQSDGGTTPKHYLMPQYGASTENDKKYYSMILSPDKGKAQFSHYMGMGIFMEEYPDRVPMGSGMAVDGRFFADGNKLKSFPFNSDSFLDETLDEDGFLNNFPRGSIIFKHYSQSGLYIREKAEKTYDLGEDGDDWSQSALRLNLSLIRQTPKFKNLGGLDDQEKPLGSFLIEDDCNNSYYNAVHMRIAHDNTGVQRISDEEIVFFDVQHLIEGGIETRIENSLPGTRPSRVQFYDLKRVPRSDEGSTEIDTFVCIHYDKDNDLCKLNLVPNDDGAITIDGKKYDEVPSLEEMATFGSGIVDDRLNKKKCPDWPGCIEGHYTNEDVDIPLAIRNTDIRVDNIDLLMKPKANAEFVHYTSSGLFFEEQLPVDENGEILYDKIKEDGSIDYDSTDLTVRNFHAPVVDLRLREWNYLPLSAEDPENEINYLDGSKSNAHEPKRYDLLNLKFETIYGDRRGDGGKGNYYEADTDKKEVSFIDEHAAYKTATKMFLGQNLYGNLLPIDGEDVIQKGNRLIFEDLLTEDDPAVPAGSWAVDSAVVNGDTRLLFPKGKLELMHYTNSGLLIEEQDITVAPNPAVDGDPDLSAISHKMAMSLKFNYWSANSDGDDQYRPVDPEVDLIDPMGIIKWHETGDVIPSLGKYAEDDTSFVDFFIYQNSRRAQHITKEADGAITWWDGDEASADADINPTGAYFAIREKGNVITNSHFREPIVDITDSVNSIKMDSKVDAQKIEITNRSEQFVNKAEGVNKIVMNAIDQVMAFMNGQEGGVDGDGADSNGNNTIVMNRDAKTIVITDANDNKIEITENGIVITDTVNANTIIMDGSGILIAAGGSTVDIAKDGDIGIESPTAVTVKGGTSVDLEAATVITVKGTAQVILESGDAALWMPNILPLCAFTGSPHGGPGAGIIKLKGA